jgi:DNA-binding PadR family transcriptional regulator
LQAPRLTTTSYIVLGLLAMAPEEEATPYDLKQRHAASVANFWSVPHAQLYRETDRLAGMGLIDERREDTGRRRRFYRLTAAGREALSEWVAEPPERDSELRDAGVLKLFLGADPAELAPGEQVRHEAKLAEYEQLLAAFPPDAPAGWVRALELGVASERTWIDYWRSLTNGRRA